MCFQWQSSLRVKIRGWCPDLCGKVEGVGAHSMTVGRKFGNLHGNEGKTQRELHSYVSKYFTLAFSAKCAQIKPPVADTVIYSHDTNSARL